MIKKTKDGWRILGDDDELLREVSELCFMVDTKHGLALFPGTEEEVEAAMNRIKRRCKKEAHHLHKVVLGREISEMEANYMLETSNAPRRVVMRLTE